MPRLAIYKIIERFITFFELMIGILLLWKLRCRYSKLLLRLEQPWWNNIINNKLNGKDRDYERLLHLGSLYIQDSKIELAIENLTKALEIDCHNKRTKDVYFLLAKCYHLKEEQDKYIEALLNSYREWKKPST